MPDSIIFFPSASKHSKLSACPTTKVPVGTDWIFQDFLDQMLHDNHSIEHVCSSDMATTFSEGLDIVARKCSLEWDGYTEDEASLPDLDNSNFGASSDFSELFDVAPVLIESTISSCTTSTEESISFRDNRDTIITQALKKRKSNSSFSSFKSFISVFSTNKKLKLDASPSKLFGFFKRRS